MKPLKVVMVILIAAVVTSVYFDFTQYFIIQKMSLDYNYLNQRFHDLNQSYNDLNQGYMTLNQTYSQMIDDLNHYNDVINQNSVFQTPITKSQAIRIALAYGGWNATSLRRQTVGAILQYMAYSDSGGAGWITDVTEPATSYFSVQNGTITYRFVWNVFIASPEPFPITYAGYFIDASSGEILCVMDTIYD